MQLRRFNESPQGPLSEARFLSIELCCFYPSDWKQLPANRNIVFRDFKQNQNMDTKKLESTPNSRVSTLLLVVGLTVTVPSDLTTTSNGVAKSWRTDSTIGTSY
jgi:hypothetical protein